MADDPDVKFVVVTGKRGRPRRIAYLELGCLDPGAKSLIAIHGMMTCRLSAMPGVKEEMLREFGIRLVSIDRPGYGRSDPCHSETFQSAARDLEQVIDALNLGQKVWLLGMSMGGAFCWGAARFIPHRIAGIAMWAPVGNYFWKGISKQERAEMLTSFGRMERILLPFARFLPFFLFQWFANQLSYDSSKGGIPPDISKSLTPEDLACLTKPGVQEKMAMDYVESLKHQHGFGVAKDLQMMTGSWGFEIKDVDKAYNGKIYIWQGNKDVLVPLQMQRWVQKQLPHKVTLRVIQGEGHFSWFFFNDAAHHETFKTLFGS